MAGIRIILPCGMRSGLGLPEPTPKHPETPANHGLGPSRPSSRALFGHAGDLDSLTDVWPHSVMVTRIPSLSSSSQLTLILIPPNPSHFYPLPCPFLDEMISLPLHDIMIPRR